MRPRLAGARASMSIPFAAKRRERAPHRCAHGRVRRQRAPPPRSTPRQACRLAESTAGTDRRRSNSTRSRAAGSPPRAAADTSTHAGAISRRPRRGEDRNASRMARRRSRSRLRASVLGERPPRVRDTRGPDRPSALRPRNRRHAPLERERSCATARRQRADPLCVCEPRPAALARRRHEQAPPLRRRRGSPARAPSCGCEARGQGRRAHARLGRARPRIAHHADR